ncbi:GTP pyrophosphokinase [Nesterenkonia marinintestina]|uniref:GTP pyrophosphokinase n=1 Tax=Nesterenkonia marinintestina TaxID=2979865 RepID=UPI0021C1082E|nr:GTP pyrophosphokinase family protein [Nesterenkonia sp. GX14115]
MTTSRSDRAQDDAALTRTGAPQAPAPVDQGPASPGHGERMMRQLLSRFSGDGGRGADPESMPNLAEIRRQLTEFQLHYKFGMDEVLTKINILREEFEHTRDYSPIEHVNFRLKSLDRILDKVQRYGIQPDLSVVRDRIRDIAGIRITCSFVSDSYWVAEMLCSQPDVRVIEVKDYISRPKPNGYRSLHVILQVPVFLSDRTEFVYVEVQIRTVAMDFWASLEHKIYYTYSGEVPEDIVADLYDAAQRARALDRQMADIRDRVSSLRAQAPHPGEGASGGAPSAEHRPDGGRWFPGAPSDPPESEHPGTA